VAAPILEHLRLSSRLVPLRPRQGLSHFGADGTVDSDFSPEPAGEVAALALSGNTLCVGARSRRSVASRRLPRLGGPGRCDRHER